MPPLSDLAPAILALAVGIGVFIAAHLTAWHAHARADKEAAKRRAEAGPPPEA